MTNANYLHVYADDCSCDFCNGVRAERAKPRVERVRETARLVPPPWFGMVLAMHRRVAIVGGPGTGKTTLASYVQNRPVVATDAFQGMEWEAVPPAIIERTSRMGSAFVVEGVTTARALRKGLRVDAVVVLETQHRPDPLPGQLAMAKGVTTVFNEWRASPGAVGVPVYREDGTRWTG